VHFRADDQAALNNGAGAGQWEEVTNWQGGGVAAPLLKRVVNSNGTIAAAPHFVTNGFDRADGTWKPGVRFCINETATERLTSYNPLATDAMSFGIDDTESTWFFAFKGMTGGAANMNWRGYWGMADASGIGWYYGLATRENSPSKFYAWGGASVMGSSFISTVAVTDGKRLIDVRDRYKTKISVAHVNSELINTANWVETVAQPVDCRLAIGNANDSLDTNADASPPMDVGELVIYNRALNDAECVIVREALTARWGLPNANALYTGAASGYCDELVGIGSSVATGSGKIAGAVETSGSSDGLTLSVASGAFGNAAGYVFAAHDGGATSLVFDAALARRRYGRAWRIESTFAEAPAVTLTFDLAEMGLDALPAAELATFAFVGKTGNSAAFAPISGGVSVDVANGTATCSFAAGTLADGAYTLAFCATPVQDGGSLPSAGLQVHFRADDQSALNNGAGATQWDEVTSWQGGGAVAPLLKPLTGEGVATSYAPHFVTNGFARADGTMAPGVRLALDESGSSRYRVNTVLISDAMSFNITSNESTWFFAFNAKPIDTLGMNWRGFWGMVEASSIGWYYGLATRGAFYAWGGATVMGSSFIGTSVEMAAGKYLMDIRDRYKTKISAAHVNGEFVNTANWVETVAQPVNCRLAIGTANETLTSLNSSPPVDFGELVIYNRALNDAECVIVREALTARWGLPNVNALYTGAASGYCDELVGIGSSITAGTGYIPGAVEASASSRGLTLAVTTGALDGAAGYVFAAGCADGSFESVQDGALRMMRLANTWRIEKVTLAAYPDLALSFDLSGYALASSVAERPAKAALLKLSNGAFEVVPGVTATYNAASDTLAFGCPTGTLADGVYTVGVADATGMTVIIR
jgi:hypothetical protein